LRVLFAYTPGRVHPAAIAALTLHAPDAELVDVAARPDSYWQAIRARWHDTRDLITVEHDIEIHDQVLPQFAACPELWCVCPYRQYPGGPVIDRGLGCTRLTAALRRQITPAQIQAMSAGTCGDCARDDQPGCWRHIDQNVTAALDQILGLRAPHLHDPVIHHHPPPGEAH
jgi:hypothetical protein